MRFFLLIPILFIWGCEEYTDPSVAELSNANVVSSTKWKVTSVDFKTNFTDQSGSYSFYLEHGPGEVDVDFRFNAELNGQSQWYNSEALDKDIIHRFFEADEDIFFASDTLMVSQWDYREYEDIADDLDYIPGFLLIGDVRLSTRVYEGRIECSYERTARIREKTYRYQLQFDMQPDDSEN
ncbi:hypothetical protein MY04_0686 [Flammeovirga sp. MY04]|uniref:hypothetical protein n=1 Tax=Flammeovirga sp. MY04 TaxID=1191459 RepID=UPI000806151F|nr:hypothetical protein [Flammeovirga sp. MY04]ANQ48068.1 hypothetical protein MY04_0686 [Flammeovirga sp. MY04]